MSENAPRHRSVEAWLRWQEGLHPWAIDLGLDRVRAVLGCLGLARPRHRVLTVGGTNGKGSCAVFLESILRAAGHRVGLYTSPHLLRYNERIRVDGREVDDAVLCEAFTRVDGARAGVSLTPFEFGTLAALEIFREAGVDTAILEVGLGGRLDAVNAVDADLALISSVGLDHTEWLGNDRESIGREKAGILRPGRPAVCGDIDPPASLLAVAGALGARLQRRGIDYGHEVGAGTWNWWGPAGRHEDLPFPRLAGAHQLANAASAIMGLEALESGTRLSTRVVSEGLRSATLRGRFEVIDGAVEWILDVTHNPHGAATLAGCLAERPCEGRTLAVLGMLASKDVAGVVSALDDQVQGWFAAGLDGPGGQGDGALAAAVAAVARAPVAATGTVAQACRSALRAARPTDRIVVLGSFRTVAAALADTAIVEEPDAPVLGERAWRPD